jgi:3-oxoacyl-[acyl-carrier protein] reductase
MESREISQQVVVITGATSGIGEAMARAFGADGASVVLAGRNGAKAQQIAAEIEAGGGAAFGMSCDVTRQSQCDALIDAAVSAYGRLDTVFANHGAAGAIGPLAQWSDDDVEQTLNVNLLGCLYLARASHAALQDGGGRFIVTGSASGRQNMLGNGMYGISKAAVSHMVRQLALEWRRDKIAVNELLPGPVRTPMSGFTSPDSTPSSQFLTYIEKMGDWLKDPSDVVPLARFIATMPVDGPSGQSYNLGGRLAGN